MDATIDLNSTIDLTADSSSSSDDDDEDVVEIVAAGLAPPPPPNDSVAKKILIADEVSASKYVDHNLETYEAMRVGDLLEFHRGLYTHWGVAIGDGKIIHLSGDDEDGLSASVGGAAGRFGSVSGAAFTISGVNFEKARVKCDDFWDVARKSKANINNSKDEHIRADAPHVIVNRALSRIGVIGYNMLWSNCEHFASWCRYGMAWSEQVDKFMRVLDRGKSMMSSAMLLIGITPGRKRPYVTDGENENSTSHKFPQLDYFN